MYEKCGKERGHIWYKREPLLFYGGKYFSVRGSYFTHFIASFGLCFWVFLQTSRRKTTDFFSFMGYLRQSLIINKINKIRVFIYYKTYCYKISNHVINEGVQEQFISLGQSYSGEVPTNLTYHYTYFYRQSVVFAVFRFEGANYITGT